MASTSLEEDPGPWLIAITVALTNLVFWMAHVHATLIADWSHEGAGSRPSWTQARHRMRNEFPLAMACLPTLVVLVLAGLGFYGVAMAVWLSLIIGIVLLAGWGFAIARVARLGAFGYLFVAGINVALGLAIVLLKVIVSH